MVGNSADVLNVRMQNDAALSIQERRRYKNAAVTTTSQLSSYDVVERFLMEHMSIDDTVLTQLIVPFPAGLTAATLVSPIDIPKTRIMS